MSYSVFKDQMFGPFGVPSVSNKAGDSTDLIGSINPKIKLFSTPRIWLIRITFQRLEHSPCMNS